MKIIHAADIHLGSKMESKFPREIAKKRREELRNTFRRMVEYATQHGVEIILLSGDIFDSDSPQRKDKEFFYDVVKGNPEITFLYLRGNHDTDADYDEAIDNLKTFSSEWTSYSFGDVVVTGIEITRGNATSMYSTLNLDREKKNIVMLHGALDTAEGKDSIVLKKLRDKHIDYLALGHIHKPSFDKLDERGVYVYSGCLEGRGFDESGERGFELLEIGEKIKHTFVPFADRVFREVNVDIGDAQKLYEALSKIKKCIPFEEKDIYRINLVGEIDFDSDEITSDLEKMLSDRCFFVNVKDRTQRKLDIHAYDGDTSLVGEFVRGVYADPELAEDEKMKIISYGLKALKGVEIE